MEISTILFILVLSAVGNVSAKCSDHITSCWTTLPLDFKEVTPIDSCYGEHACNCSSTTADCSSSGLTFIPNLHRNYQVLNFSGNKVSSIPSADFLANVSVDVQILDLFNNGLTYIARNAFNNLKNLTSLLLGGSNNLDYQVVLEILTDSPFIHNLDLNCLNLGPVSVDTFENITNSSLKNFSLGFNHLQSIDFSAFQPLQNLKALLLESCELYDLTTAHLPLLDTLNLNQNRLFEFPQTCDFSNNSSSEALFPHLAYLNLSNNMIDCLPESVCLSKLKMLDLSFNHFTVFETNAFSVTSFPSLKRLYLMQMENKIEKIMPSFVNNSGVTYLDLKLNNVDFSSHVVPPNVFEGCTSVKQLYLKGNYFHDVSVDLFHSLLKPMEATLKYLNLGKASITNISPDTFSRLKALHTLILYGNELTVIPDGVFDALSNLTRLELDQNHIATITESSFGPHLQEGLQVLTLFDNPFECSCQILWFQQWMRNNSALFNYSLDGSIKNDYSCTNLNITLSQFVLNDQACLLSFDAAVFTIITTCLLIFFLLLFTFLFRFRWHMRLWLYEICRDRRPRFRNCLFKYDIFLSYAEENAAWVERELLPVLEGRWRQRVCAHHRDFLPGKHIVDNIADCLNDSERVLLVFSQHFARSEWCQFELKYCQACVMERDDVIVLVSLDEARRADLTSAMMALLKTTTYIKWEDEPYARASFWGRLRVALDMAPMEEIHTV